MKNISTKMVAVFCAVALIAGAGITMALSPLHINLGLITTTNNPADVDITSAKLGQVSGTIVGDDTVNFASSGLAVGASNAETLTVVLHNSGGTTATIGTIAIIQSTSGILTIVANPANPTTVLAGADATLTWTVTAIAVGSTTPTLSVPWS